jgi:hypothetical protein
MSKRAASHPDAERPTRDMDPAMLAKLVSEAKPLDRQLAAHPDNHLHIDVTTPIDISELIPLQPMPKTIPIDRSMIVEVVPVMGGTAIASHRGWFGRVWDVLTRRGSPSV